MLGTVCFLRNTSLYSAKVAVSQAQNCTFRAYSIQLTSRTYTVSPNLSRCFSWPSYHDSCTNGNGHQEIATIEKCCSFGNVCVEEGSVEANCATIWHGSFPCLHQSTPDKKYLSVLKQSFDAGELGFVPWSLPYKEQQGLRRLVSRASNLLDGSWNAAWDARPARWLHGKHCAWLLFGICTRACFPGALSISVLSWLSKALQKTANVTIEDPRKTFAKNKPDSLPREAAKNLQSKPVYTNYEVIGIPSDGRCLFRAIAHGACIRNGEPAPDESLQQRLADDLRSKVVSELINRRSESEWFIEEDFDVYVQRMREPYVWGGEPELLMASHVLKMPITVLFFDQSSNGLMSIVEYGSEYGSENPIRILYHGFGHYDAVEIFST